MNFLCITFIIIGVISKTYGLSCYSCSDSTINGESTDTDVCVTTVATGSTTTVTSPCTADSTGIINYCRTLFTVTDGVVTGVSRGCIGSDLDEDGNTAAVPSNNKCVSVIDATGIPTNPTDTTTCYYHCTTDDCNTITTTSLIKCSSDCNIGVGGSCNYLTGTCVCLSAFSGSDCTTAVTAVSTVQRKCVQCNSETDTGCATSTTSVDCPGTETYCSTATTTIIATDTTVFRTITTRGCTSVFKAVDECSFTDIFTDVPISSNPPGYKEFTCFSTCNTDGCNTNTADGVINGNEAITLQCVQCSDLVGGTSCNPGSLPRTTCASGSTHCKSTVTYLTSDKTDLSHTEAAPAYDLVSVVRECATASVTSACTETTIGSLSLKKVTCTETCQGDGCNIGWPARPTCIQCASSNPDSDGHDECLENPSIATYCTFPYQGYCVLRDTGIQKGLRSSIQGYPRRITRGCSHYDIGTGCSSGTLRITEIESCNRTCTTDGCNVGSGSTMPIQTIVAILVPTVLGWIAQSHF